MRLSRRLRRQRRCASARAGRWEANAGPPFARVAVRRRPRLLRLALPPLRTPAAASMARRATAPTPSLPSPSWTRRRPRPASPPLLHRGLAGVASPPPACCATHPAIAGALRTAEKSEDAAAGQASLVQDVEASHWPAADPPQPACRLSCTCSHAPLSLLGRRPMRGGAPPLRAPAPMLTASENSACGIVRRRPRRSRVPVGRVSRR